MKGLILALLSLPFALHAASPFANNLYGLKYVVLEISGDEKPAKKAGYPFDAIRKDIKGALESAGIKVVKGQSDVPDGKKGMPMELILGMVNKKDLYSYALTLQAYEPMRVDNGNRLYVAWTSMLYGFGTQDSVKSMLQGQVKVLSKGFTDDLKAAKKR
jgi:hypothetical protein